MFLDSLCMNDVIEYIANEICIYTAICCSDICNSESIPSAYCLDLIVFIPKIIWFRITSGFTIQADTGIQGVIISLSKLSFVLELYYCQY